MSSGLLLHGPEDGTVKKRGGNKLILTHPDSVLTNQIWRTMIQRNFFQRAKGEQTWSSGEVSYQSTPGNPPGSSSGMISRVRDRGKRMAWSKNHASQVAWKDFQEACSRSKRESDMYKPLAKLLTLLAIEMNAGLLFIPWDCVALGDDDEQMRQDIIAVKATFEEIKAFHKSNQSMNCLPVRFYAESGSNAGKPAIYYSDIMTICEVKPLKVSGEISDKHMANAAQLIKYFTTTSRYQPHHSAHLGLLVYKNGFLSIGYYPDATLYSPTFHNWESNTAQQSLLNFISSFKTDKRPFTTNQFHLRPLNSPEEHPELNNMYSRLELHITSANHDVGGDPEALKYQLYDLYRGHGWTRNAYVALGLRIGTLQNLKPKDCVVVKHGWHDIRHHANELDVFKHIYGSEAGAVDDRSRKMRCRVGLVRADLDLSRVIGTDITEIPDQQVTRESLIIILRTVGRTLADCKSVKQFLMVMYDLVEVHRALVEDHGILHRDISWNNVLIDALHLDNDAVEDLCGRPFIDVILNKPEKDQQVHATLSDFDCACILEGSINGTMKGEITGTPAFMATSLCSISTDPDEISDSMFHVACRRVFGENLGLDVFNDCPKRKSEVQETFEVANLLDGNKDIISFGEEERVIHAPIHDAESIFWIMVFFFNRAYPAGYNPEANKREPEMLERRTQIFNLMIQNAVGNEPQRITPSRKSTPPQFLPFLPMLFTLRNYFDQPWYCCQKDKYSIPPFHGHNALQYLLRQTIVQLDHSGDVQLKELPLPIIKDRGDIAIPSSTARLLYRRKQSRNIMDKAPSKMRREVPRNRDKKTPARTSMKILSNREGKSSIHSELDHPESARISPEDQGLMQSLIGALNSVERSKLWFMGCTQRWDSEKKVWDVSYA